MLLNIFLLVSFFSAGQNNIFEPLYFGYNISTPLTDCDSILSAIVQFMNHCPEAKLEITGHTDNKGTEEYNQLLAQKRSEYIKYLINNKGIINSRLCCLSKGESQPVEDNTTTNGQQMNRRVEFRVILPESDLSDTDIIAKDSLLDPHFYSSVVPAIYKTQGITLVRNKSITIALSDWHIVDGDIINVIVNNEVLAENIVITGSPKILKYHNLSEGDNWIGISVVSSGMLGGASPGIEINDGKKRQRFEIKAYMGNPGAYIIRFDSDTK